jgi:transcriptional regulator with XRE-family HTH domain
MSPVNVSSIGSYIREQREQARISIRQLAQAAGVSNPYLSQVERGLRRPSADILQQIAKGLRISAEALYVQAGILEEKTGENTVTEAIKADTEITERQKQMLVDIYESFRKEVRADAEAARGASAADAEAAQGASGADAQSAADTEIGQGGTTHTDDGIDTFVEDVEESENDPIAVQVAAAEAEPWSDPPGAGNR